MASDYGRVTDNRQKSNATIKENYKNQTQYLAAAGQTPHSAPNCISKQKGL
jgi:hypothetical protein